MKKKVKRAPKLVCYEPAWHYLDNQCGIWLSDGGIGWQYASGPGGFFIAIKLRHSITQPNIKAVASGLGFDLNIEPEGYYTGRLDSLIRSFPKTLRLHPALMKPNYFYQDATRKLYMYLLAGERLWLETKANSYNITFSTTQRLQSFWSQSPPLMPTWLADYTSWFVQAVLLNSGQWQDPRPILWLLRNFGSFINNSVQARLYEHMLNQFKQDTKSNNYQNPDGLGKLAWWLAHTPEAFLILGGMQFSKSAQQKPYNLLIELIYTQLQLRGELVGGLELSWLNPGKSSKGLGSLVVSQDEYVKLLSLLDSCGGRSSQYAKKIKSISKKSPFKTSIRYRPNQLDAGSWPITAAAQLVARICYNQARRAG